MIEAPPPLLLIMSDTLRDFFIINSFNLDNCLILLYYKTVIKYKNMGLRKKNNKIIAGQRKKAAETRAAKKNKRDIKGKTAGQKLAEKMAGK